MERAALDPLFISEFPTEQNFLSKSNTEENNKEPVTEVGLALSCENRCTQRWWYEDSGAGANASSRRDMIFVTGANALSELVWSPHRGLSLKCADSNLADKKPSLICHIGSSNMVISPSQSIIDKGRNNDGPMAEVNFNSSASLEGIQESMAENDLQPLKGEINVADEGKLSPQKNEGIDSKGKAVPAEASLINSGVHLYQRKGKEKAFSDGDVNGTTLKEKSDSNESVESCNSFGFLLKGKRQWNFEQNLSSVNKKMKKEIHRCPNSASEFRQDSSFVNWISNMMKGLPKSDQNETPLALTVGTLHRHGICDQNFILHDKKQNPMGFQTIFQALYCPNMREKNRGSWNHDCLTESSKKLEKMSNENSTLPSISSVNITKNNNLNMVCGIQKVGVSVISSSLKNDPDHPSEGGEVSKVGSIDPNKSLISVANRTPPGGSLWLTRFSLKASSPIKSSNLCRLSESGDVLGFNDSENSRNHVVSANDQNDSKDGREISSQGVKNSEAMASVFARRLDALKHIIPSKGIDNESESLKTCSFCGVKGHSLIEWHHMGDQILTKNEKIPEENNELYHRMSGKMILRDREIMLKENPEVASEIFEGLRRVRLSRTDVLKWMKSPTSHLCLDGFFLRLRLGKLEEGLGGTGYYVASFNGAQREGPLGSSKAPLSVSIGDFKCLVEIRYISNHDFTEEELKAWWCTTSKSGNKLPSIEELKMKLEERKKFGF